MPSFLRGMFQGRRPTTTTRGSTEVPHPLLPAALPRPLSGSVLHSCRESACETQTHAALSVDERQRIDEEEQAYRARTGQDRIAKAIAARGAWFPGD